MQSMNVTPQLPENASMQARTVQASGLSYTRCLSSTGWGYSGCAHVQKPYLQLSLHATERNMPCSQAVLNARGMSACLSSITGTGAATLLCCRCMYNSAAQSQRSGCAAVVGHRSNNDNSQKNDATRRSAQRRRRHNRPGSRPAHQCRSASARSRPLQAPAHAPAWTCARLPRPHAASPVVATMPQALATQRLPV